VWPPSASCSWTSSRRTQLSPHTTPGRRREKSLRQSPEELGKERNAHLRASPSITAKGMGPSMSMEGSADTESFGLYMRGVLAPRLEAGQIVVMDNLSVHKSRWVRELIEQRGCQLWHLPSYSRDFNPIEEAFSKVKGLLRRAKARTLQGLFEATHHALSAITHEDARGRTRLLRALRIQATTGPFDLNIALNERCGARSHRTSCPVPRRTPSRSSLLRAASA
jgi:transposase